MTGWTLFIQFEGKTRSFENHHGPVPRVGETVTCEFEYDDADYGPDVFYAAYKTVVSVHYSYESKTITLELEQME